jgi:hypothetical protein
MNACLKSLGQVPSALALASPLKATAAQYDCTVKSRSSAVVLMHCKTHLQDSAWVKAAKSACEPGKACNVWIWEDLSMIPLTALSTDAELPKSATGAAVAV